MGHSRLIISGGCVVTIKRNLDDFWVGKRIGVPDNVPIGLCCMVEFLFYDYLRKNVIALELIRYCRSYCRSGKMCYLWNEGIFESFWSPIQ